MSFFECIHELCLAHTKPESIDILDEGIITILYRLSKSIEVCSGLLCRLSQDQFSLSEVDATFEYVFHCIHESYRLCLGILDKSYYFGKSGTCSSASFEYFYHGCVLSITSEVSDS